MRRDAFSRKLMQENHFTVDMLIQPFFIIEGQNKREPVESMPGVERLSIDQLIRAAEELASLGVPAIVLFPLTEPSSKTAGSVACRGRC